MTVKPYSTSFKGANPTQDPDPITNVMPDLDNETGLNVGDGDEARTSHITEPRDKLDTACKLIGDSVNNPAGSICDIIARDHANGDATQVRFRVRATAPAPVTGKTFIYCLDDGGVKKVYVKWDDGTEILIGTGGGGGQTNTVVGSSGITNVGDNVDADLAPTYGSSANTICQGNDSRLSDARAPTGAASGDLTGTYPGPTVDAGAIDNTKLADMVQATLKGRASGAGTGDPTDLTAAQATAILDAFTSVLKGVVPASGGGTTNFLRADATWAAPPGGGGQTNTVAGSSGITNVGDNVDADLAPTYGATANTVCQGNDARLSDSRAPTGAASGDLTGTYPGPTIDAGAVDNTKLADMVQATLKGRAAAAGTGDPTDLTSAQATAILDLFTSGLQGLVPASGGGTTNFLRADGSFAAPIGGGGSPLTTKGDIWGYDTADDRVPVGTDNHVLTADSAQGLGVKYAAVANASMADMVQATIKGRASGAGTGAPVDLTAAQATAILDAFTSSLKGLVPASGGGTTNFLRADGSWVAPAGGGGGFDREQEFTAAASPLETFTLAAPTAVNANTPSGYSVRVYVNGLKHKYSSSSPGAREFDIIAANQIRVGGLNISDDVEIVYGV